jgi:mono/diheme cytochrome c family protein
MGEHGMKFLLLGAGFLSAGLACVSAQEARPEASQAGHVMVLSKCFQCHTDAMYRDLRQDRRAWEATVYRMIGHGALWTPEEIKLMADYLGVEFGPAAKSPATPR